jgi:hypothetical protein
MAAISQRVWCPASLSVLQVQDVFNGNEKLRTSRTGKGSRPSRRPSTFEDGRWHSRSPMTLKSCLPQGLGSSPGERVIYESSCLDLRCMAPGNRQCSKFRNLDSRQGVTRARRTNVIVQAFSPIRDEEAGKDPQKFMVDLERMWLISKVIFGQLSLQCSRMHKRTLLKSSF